MLFLLAKTEWSSLGELIGEYLFTPGYAMHTPILSILAYVLLSTVIACYLFGHLSSTPTIENYDVILCEVFLSTKSVSALWLPFLFENSNYTLLILTFGFIFIADAYLLCRNMQASLSELFVFLLLTTILSFLVACAAYVLGIFCVLSFIICLCVFVWLIKHDKLSILEQLWESLLHILDD